MPRAITPIIIPKHASTIVGAFCLLLLSSCNEKKSTPNWEQSPQPAKESPQQKTEAPKPGPKPSPPPFIDTTGADHVRFLSYNLKNYLTMRRYINGRTITSSKPEDEIEALIEVITTSKPDILGVCEIGSPTNLKDLQTRLKTAGVDLPHAHQVLDYDKVRTLAILSRYPITSTGKLKDDSYSLSGHHFKISRGILDATVQLPSKQIRFLGVHFKSKRPIPEADQELMRRSESYLLRKHINNILNASPNTHVIAYGDFNDTKRTPTLRTAMGRLNSKTGLIVLHPTDSRGELWTHHWTREDIYSRFDFVMASKNLIPHIDQKASHILDPDNWKKASDHRAIMVLISP